MKRMEPLTEENKKLWEALNLSEKSIKRAPRERDLAESNSRDLEHQKGVLSEQLMAASEQLKKKSKQLAIVSEELKNMSEQLGKKTGELKNKSEQLDRKCQQFEDVSNQKSDMPYHIMYFAIACQPACFNNCCACRARRRTQPASPDCRAILTRESESVRASRQTG